MGKPKFQNQISPSEKGWIRSSTSASATTSFEQEHPIFSLACLQDEYCISRCDKNDKASFAECLRKLSKLTWKEISMNGRHSLGYEHIPRNAIHASIPPNIKEDVTFLAFRFSGKKPMVGYRKDAVFHILWLDRHFNLYDHG